jgi:hypothetical protein
VSRYSSFLSDAVSVPLTNAGFSKHRNVWKRQLGHVSVGVDLQGQRSVDLGKCFTLNFGANVPGKAAFFDGSSDDGQYHQGDLRIGALRVPFEDLWWCVADDHVTVGEPYGSHRPSSEGELSDLVMAVAQLLNLKQPSDVDRFPTLRPIIQDAIKAAWKWCAAGQPMVELATVEDSSNSFRIVIPQAIERDRPDLISSLFDFATPYNVKATVESVHDLENGELSITTRGIVDKEALRNAYQRFLSVRLFSPTPIAPSHTSFSDVDLNDVDESTNDTLSIELSDSDANHEALERWVLAKQEQWGPDSIWLEDRNQILFRRSLDVDPMNLEIELFSYLEQGRN